MCVCVHSVCVCVSWNNLKIIIEKILISIKITLSVYRPAVEVFGIRDRILFLLLIRYIGYSSVLQSVCKCVHVCMCVSVPVCLSVCVLK